jgi:outer membrane lipoprotein
MAGPLLVPLLVVKRVESLHDPFELGRILAGCLVLLLAGCASTSPFNEVIRSRVDASVTPERVVVDYPSGRNREVLWGGRILEGRNLVDSTELTVLAFPIDSKGMPDTEGDVPLGRFVVQQEGYLETVTFAPGREITVYGRVVGVREVAVEAARHKEPVVAATQIHLWQPTSAWGGPVFHLGIGVSGGF